MRSTTLRYAAVGGALALTAAATIAGAAPAAAPPPVTALKGLTSPLSMAVTAKGGLLVSENNLHTIVAKGKGKPTRTKIGKKGDEIGGLSTSGGDIYLAWTPASGSARVVKASLGGGRTTLVGDVGKYESKHNPDADVTYGFRDLDESCAAEFPENTPASYTGGIESHPFATAVKGKTTYVADAGGNTILALRGGKVSTVAVLPAVPAVITSEQATALGMPDCVVGETYWLEPVPTDVEIAPGGDLDVTSLPGGPEDGSLGALGRVLTIDPSNGDTTVLASGFLGATGLAVRKNGDVYVAELFANRISRVRAGSSTPNKFASIRNPAAVEIADGLLLVTANAFADGDGRVVAYGL